MNVDLINANASGVSFTDFSIPTAGSAAVTLTSLNDQAHDWFWGGTSLTIRTASGGGGTLLTEGAGNDYVLSVTNANLGTFSGKTTYNKIQIVNASYQATTLYLSGSWIGDSVQAEDVNNLKEQVLTTAGSMTIADGFRETNYLVTPTSADATITLPTLADNQDIVYTFIHNGTGTGNTIIDGEGSETINGQTSITLSEQYNRITIVAASDEWKDKARYEREIQFTTAGSMTIADNFRGGTYIVTPTSADATITLPTLSANQGIIYTFIHNGSGTGDTIVQGEGAETINGGTVQTIYNQYGTMTVIGTSGEWKKISEAYSNDIYMGGLHMLAEENRPSAFVLNGGNDLTFTDVDFSAYVPIGVKALLLYSRIRLDGDGAADVARILVRQNGSSESDFVQVLEKEIRFSNLAGGLDADQSGISIVRCDENGIIEYAVHPAATTCVAYINIYGYFLPENS